MIKRLWKARPLIGVPSAGIWLGSGPDTGDGVWIGTLAENVDGKQPKVWASTGKEQVIGVVGKRGSGKSFTLGVVVEGLVGGIDTVVGRQEAPRAVLMFDPLDIYWTTRYSVAESGNPEAQRHFQLAKSAGLLGLEFEVDAWVPGALHRSAADPTWFKTLQLSVSALRLEEWEILLGVSTMTDPMGHALVDALRLVRDTGYTLAGEATAPVADFDLEELALAVGADELTQPYHGETLRALRQRLRGLSRTGLFSAVGTPISDLLTPGRASIVLLRRLPPSHQSAIVGVLTRMVMDHRAQAAFAEKRLALDPDLDSTDRDALQAIADKGVPRTVIVLDEAQSFLSPGSANPALDMFVRLVKEGRNIGLSAVVATQQPAAIDKRILSQVETFLAHQLVTEPDIRAVRENLKASLPDSIHSGKDELDASTLLRQLSAGTCFVSAADMNTTIRRSIIVAIRPRATVHGGIEL
jgi:uncharacterized protein